MIDRQYEYLLGLQKKEDVEMKINNFSEKKKNSEKKSEKKGENVDNEIEIDEILVNYTLKIIHCLSSLHADVFTERTRHSYSLSSCSLM